MRLPGGVPDCTGGYGRPSQGRGRAASTSGDRWCGLGGGGAMTRATVVVGNVLKELRNFWVS